MNISVLSKQFLQIVLLSFILLIGYYYISYKTDALIADKYLKVSTDMKAQLKTFIEEEQNTILVLSLAIAENKKIKKALLTDDISNIHLDKFSLRLKRNTTLNNTWFQIVRADGTSIYRNFSKKKGDNILKSRVDIATIVKHPQIITSISVGKFAISLKAMIPIYENKKFIGIIETIVKFNSIVTKMDEKKYETILFIDKSYKKQLVFADKNKFYGDYFMASGSQSSNFLKYIKEKTAEHIINYNKNYHLCKEINSIVCTYTLKSDITQKPLAYFVMAHNINDIDLTNIYQIRYNLFLILVGLLLMTLALFVYIYIVSRKKLTQELNDTLEEKVQTTTKELSHLAHYDILTNLMKRHLFSNRVASSIKRTKPFRILFLDLDKFKNINERYGHNTGDALLKSVAKRLLSSVKSEDVVARVGGDEFIILIEDVNDEELVSIIERIRSKIQEPVKCKNEIFTITFSIGVSSFPKDGTDSETLISYADMAMYKAKELGRNTFASYDKKMGEEMLKRLELEKNLKVALKENQFEAFYQPQVDAHTNRVVGAEALIRWNSSELGFVPPDKFIPVAEESGLIIEIDSWMMQETMNQLMVFQEEGIEIGKLSLNLSARQLESKDMMHHLKMMLDTTGFDPQRLELEITERQMMKDPELSIAILNKIEEMGIDIAVDDFGTGHSSLAYIKRLPIDKLKIDKSFVDDLPDDKEDIAIVRSILSIAKNLEINTITEGVESKLQRDFLRDEGCKLIQGYFYSKPLNAEDYKQYLLDNNI